MRTPISDPNPPTELAVVGENTDDPSQLILLGADGNYYAYALPDGTAKAVVPDEHWRVDAIDAERLLV
ncbi:MAG: hypothetical protein AVDCRST_MAG49-3306 [uncultured Thermomicrobiales bacterium]|uniref:Uncharacterized protein n=1 Tax=uncultured Thermomicrobiales bacterium TaxID=1645740 RepID=A0A6J4V4G7_9BACT|nr:MAG: hypothetical protein AVDCRST_MAG49-3306 [uncultured Thermomicrobiales bacterium]